MKYFGVLCFAILLTALAAACAGTATTPAPSAPTVTVTAPTKTVTQSPTATATTAPKTYLIRISSENGPTYPDEMGWTKFKALVEARSQGQVKVETYFNGALYKGADAFPAVVSGSVEMTGVGQQQAGEKTSPSAQMFNLPSFFGTDMRDVLRMLGNDTEVGKGIIAEVERRPVKVLGFWGVGGKVQMFSNKNQIRTPKDLVSLRMRTSGGALAEDVMKLLGASPVTIPAAETYMAIKTGVIDGGETSFNYMVQAKWNEVFKYATATNHSTTYRFLLINRALWDSMPGNLQWMIQATVNELIPYVNEIQLGAADWSRREIERVTKNPVYNLTDADKKAFTDSLAPLEEKYIVQYGVDRKLLKIAQDWLISKQ